MAPTLRDGESSHRPLAIGAIDPDRPCKEDRRDHQRCIEWDGPRCPEGASSTHPARTGKTQQSRGPLQIRTSTTEHMPLRVFGRFAGSSTRSGPRVSLVTQQTVGYQMPRRLIIVEVPLGGTSLRPHTHTYRTHASAVHQQSKKDGEVRSRHKEQPAIRTDGFHKSVSTMICNRSSVAVSLGASYRRGAGPDERESHLG